MDEPTVTLYDRAKSFTVLRKGIRIDFCTDKIEGTQEEELETVDRQHPRRLLGDETFTDRGGQTCT